MAVEYYQWPLRYNWHSPDATKRIEGNEVSYGRQEQVRTSRVHLYRSEGQQILQSILQ